VRSLTIRIGQYLVKQRKRSFGVTGVGLETEGQRFSLWEREPGRWRVSWNASNGERLRCQIRADSLEIAVEKGADAIYGTRGAEELESLTVDEIFLRWGSIQTCNDETKGTYVGDVKLFLKWLTGSDIMLWSELRLQHLSAYANRLARIGKSRRTVERRCFPIRSAARFAARNWPEYFRDFSAGFRLPKVHKDLLYQDQEGKVFLPLAEAGEFLVWLRDQPGGWGILPGIALQALCAMRIREVLRLKWSGIDLVLQTVTIEGKVKNVHSVRRLPLPRLAYEILAESPRNGERVVPEYKQEDSYGQALKRFLAMWKPDFILEPKGLRRTLPSEAMRRGWSGFALERYLGHSPKSIMERHYIAQTHDQIVDLFREQVVPKVDQILAPALAKWHQTGTLANVVEMPRVS